MSVQALAWFDAVRRFFSFCLDRVSPAPSKESFGSFFVSFPLFNFQGPIGFRPPAKPLRCLLFRASPCLFSGPASRPPLKSALLLYRFITPLSIPFLRVFSFFLSVLTKWGMIRRACGILKRRKPLSPPASRLYRLYRPNPQHSGRARLLSGEPGGAGRGNTKRGEGPKTCKGSIWTRRR